MSRGRGFKLTQMPPLVDGTSSDTIPMTDARDDHWIDRYAVHTEIGGGLPQTSLQALPGHLPASAELSSISPQTSNNEQYYQGGGGGGGTRHRSGGGGVRRYIRRPIILGGGDADMDDIDKYIQFALLAAIAVLLLLNLIMSVLTLTTTR